MKPSSAVSSVVLLLLLSFLLLCLHCEAEKVDLSKYYNTSSEVNVEVITISNLDEMETLLQRFGYEPEEIEQMREQFQKQIDAISKLGKVEEEDDDDDDDEDDMESEKDLDFAEHMRYFSKLRGANSKSATPNYKQNKMPNQNKMGTKGTIKTSNYNNIGSKPNFKNAQHAPSPSRFPSASNAHSNTPNMASKKSVHPPNTVKPTHKFQDNTPTHEPAANPTPHNSYYSNTASAHKPAYNQNSAQFAQNSANFANSANPGNPASFANTCQTRKSTCTKCSTISKQCQSDEVLSSGGCHASSALSGNFQSNFGDMYGISGGQFPPQWFCTTEKEAEFINVYVTCCKVL